MIPLLSALAHNRPRRQAFPWLGLAVLTAALTACASSLPSLTPKSNLAPTLEPVRTATLSPLLLTPVATSTREQGGGTATPVLDLTHPNPTCEATPMWGLGDVWSNEAVRTRIGCPVGNQVGVAGAKMEFERGVMLWRPDAGLIYVLTPGDPDGRWAAFTDTYVETDPVSDPAIVAPTPAAGASAVWVQPTGRFGKVWRQNPVLSTQLGWAVVPAGAAPADGEISFQGAAQDFVQGVLFWDTTVCFVLRTDDMSWTR